MSFDRLGLGPELLRAVADQGYTVPTPIQEQAIPVVLAGRDLLAAAQTGTGKTAAFALPILELMRRADAARPAEAALPPSTTRPAELTLPQETIGPRRGRPHPMRRPVREWAAPGPIRVLILVPTRELAVQVEAHVRLHGAGGSYRSVAIFGGVGFDPQVRAIRSGPAIVVATPGRLLDHVNQRTIDLSKVEYLVLDEADRMLDMGFIRPIRSILALLPAKRQNLLFSATFSDEVRSLAGGLLVDPASVDVAPRNAPAELVDQLVLRVDRERKRELLSHLLLTRRLDQALVFTRTKHGANRLAEQLDGDGIAAAALHGNKSQGQRTRALADFKAGRVTVLVATDLAARGIDIDSLPHVVNYELPMVASDYVHRIGRTGRAGVDGQAISLVCVDEAQLLREIETLLRRPIASETVAGFEPDRSIRSEPIGLRTGGSRPAPVGRRGFSGGSFGSRPPAAAPRPYLAPRPFVGNTRPAGAPTPKPFAGNPRPFSGDPRPAGNGPRPDGHRPGTGFSRPSGAPARPDGRGPRPDSYGPRPADRASRPVVGRPAPIGGPSRPAYPDHPGRHEGPARAQHGYPQRDGRSDGPMRHDGPPRHDQAGSRPRTMPGERVARHAPERGRGRPRG